MVERHRADYYTSSTRDSKFVIAERQLTARSVMASTLLGTEPPVLSARVLVRAAAMFGITEGAAPGSRCRAWSQRASLRRATGRTG